MNNARRTQLTKIKETISGLMSELESLQEQEQEAYDNMPEGLQASERGEKCEAAISSIEDAISALNDVCDSLESAAE